MAPSPGWRSTTGINNSPPHLAGFRLDCCPIGILLLDLKNLGKKIYTPQVPNNRSSSELMSIQRKLHGEAGFLYWKMNGSPKSIFDRITHETIGVLTHHMLSVKGNDTSKLNWYMTEYRSTGTILGRMTVLEPAPRLECLLLRSRTALALREEDDLLEEADAFAIQQGLGNVRVIEHSDTRERLHHLPTVSLAWDLFPCATGRDDLKFNRKLTEYVSKSMGTRYLCKVRMDCLSLKEARSEVKRFEKVLEDRLVTYENEYSGLDEDKAKLQKEVIRLRESNIKDFNNILGRQTRLAYLRFSDLYDHAAVSLSDPNDFREHKMTMVLPVFELLLTTIILSLSFSCLISKEGSRRGKLVYRKMSFSDHFSNIGCDCIVTHCEL